MLSLKSHPPASQQKWGPPRHPQGSSPDVLWSPTEVSAPCLGLITHTTCVVFPASEPPLAPWHGSWGSSMDRHGWRDPNLTSGILMGSSGV